MKKKQSLRCTSNLMLKTREVNIFFWNILTKNLLFQTYVRTKNMGRAQIPFFVTLDNQITLIQLIHVNIPFKMKKYNDNYFCNDC